MFSYIVGYTMSWEMHVVSLTFERTFEVDNNNSRAVDYKI